MKIGELSAATGLANSAIRFYEQSGLLPAAVRDANGYRNYAPAAVNRLRIIQMAQTLGITLDTLRTAFGSGEGFRQDTMRANLDARLTEIDQVLRTLRQQRKELLAVRSTLDGTWEEGKCLNVDELTHRLAAQTPKQ